MKMLKNINSKLLHIISIALLTILFHSCDFITTKSCTLEEYEDMKKISAGDYETYIRFMENHEPDFECFYGSLTPYDLSISVSSTSPKIYSDFFSRKINQDTKNHFMMHDWQGDSDSLIWIVIQAGGQLKDFNSHCDSLTLPSLQRLQFMGYDLRKVILANGNNLFLEVAIKDSQRYDNCDCLVETLKYLKKIGVNTESKNYEGKSAKELAKAPCVVEYLKSLD